MYKGKNIIFVVLIFFLSCGGGSITQYEEEVVPDASAMPEPTVGVEGPIVKIGYGSSDGNSFIKVKDDISSPEDLAEYKKIKDAETLKILELTKDFPNEVQYPSVVTFNEPVSREKVENIAKNAGEGASVRVIKYVSTHGGGEIPYEMLDTQAMKDLELRLKKIQKRDNNIDDFQLVKGVSALKGGLNRDAIQSIADDPKTFVVDIGPVEMYEKGGVQAAWDDVANKVAQFGTK